MGYILAIDIGGTYIKSALMKGDAIVPLPKAVTPKEGLEALLNTIKGIFDQQPDVEGIAVCSPGIIDDNTGFMYTGGGIEYIRNLDMPGLLKKLCGNVAINIANDAKSAALAELRLGTLKNVNDGIIITIGTALGGAVIHNREVISGSHHFAGEFSMMNMTELASMPSREPWGRLGSRRISTIYLEKTGRRQFDISPEEVFECAKTGEAEALGAIREYCDLFAPNIANLQCITDPEVIAIGGGISEQPILIETLKERVHFFQETYRSEQPVYMPDVRIEACRFSDNSVGAYLCFKDRFPQMGL